MKCPDCGNELNGKEICGKCGREIKARQQDIEVEYKEFKISEFLEIRKVQQQLPAKDSSETLSSVVFEQESGPSDKYSGRQMQQTMPAEKGKKNKFLVFTVVTLIILAAIIGAVYITHFFFR